MTDIAGHSPFGGLVRLLRDPASWMAAADLFAILTAFVMPFSTSLTAIFIVAMLIAWIPFLDLRAFLQSLRRPIAAVPIAFFALALVGTLWSDAVWGTRLYAVFPTAKLLMLPVLFYHFERSGRGVWVMIAFLVSCTLMMILSWAVTCAPYLTMKPAADASRGIFVKNYIDQSQEFTLCAVALAFPVVQLLACGKNLAGGGALRPQREPDRQHGVRGGVADRARHLADPVRRFRPAVFAAAGQLAHARCGRRRRACRLARSVRDDMVERRAERLRGASPAETRDECRAARNADLAVTRMDLQDLRARLSAL